MGNKRDRRDHEGAWHHVMNQGTAKSDIFRDDSDRRFFNWLLSQIGPRFGMEVHAYAQLGNHYHLLARSSEGRLSEAMQWLGTGYAARFNRRHERVGAFFRGRFESQLVDDERYLAWLPIYIHLNPVHDGFARQPEDWRWSSYAAIAGYRPRESWLASGVVAAGRSPLEYRRLTAQYQRSERPRADRRRWGSPKEVRRGWESHATSGVVQRVERAVMQAFGSEADQLRRPSGHNNPARTTAIGLLAQVAHLRRSDIAALYGLRSEQAVSAAAQRATVLLRSDHRAAAAAESLRLAR